MRESAARLESNSAYVSALLGSESQAFLDACAKLAAEVSGTAAAMVNIVRGEQQITQASYGLGYPKTAPLEASLCPIVIRDGRMLVIPDTLADRLYSEKSYAHSDPPVRFYTGAPLHDPDGGVLGILCVIDRIPRHLTQKQIDAIATLAKQAEALLSLQWAILERNKVVDDLAMTNRRLASALSRESLISKIGNAVRSSFDARQILEATVALLGEGVKADRCYYVTYDQESDLGRVWPQWRRGEEVNLLEERFRMSTWPYNRVVDYQKGQTHVVRDVLENPDDPGARESVAGGIRSLLRVPLYHDTVMTALAVAMSDDAREWTEDEIALVETVAAQTRAAVESARHLRSEREMMRDMLSSVTEGCLTLCDEESELPAMLEHGADSPLDITGPEKLGRVRELARNAAALAEHSDERAFDLMTAAGEAAMNAVVHAPGGTAWITYSEKGTVQVRIKDEGVGIAMRNLPKATLARGYSTASTLGHGLKMILATADRIYLLTGPGGTTIILEQERTAPGPKWLEEWGIEL